MPAKKTASRPPVAAPKEPEIVPHDVEEIFVFNNLDNADDNAALLQDEYVQVTEVMELFEGQQFYKVQAFENNEDGSRVGTVRHDELSEPTDEQQAYLSDTYGGDDAAEADTEEEGEVEEAAESEAVTESTGKVKGKAKGAATGKTKTKGAKAPIVFSGLQTLLADNPGVNLIDVATELSERANETWFDLAEAIAMIKANKSYTSIKGEDGVTSLYPEKGGFAKFVSEHLHVQYRVAQYWINIVKSLKALGKASPELLAMGWPKLKELVPVINSYAGLKVPELTKELTPLIDFAKVKKHTAHDIKDKIKEEGWIRVDESAEGEEESAEKVVSAPIREPRKKFDFFTTGADQEALVNQALALAKEKGGITEDDTNGAAKAWLIIVDSFLALESTPTVAAKVAAPAKKVAAPAKKVAARPGK